MSGAVVPFPTPFHAMSDGEVETGLLGIAGHIAAAQCRASPAPCTSCR
mgnify:CR=1 FL=1|jgi:hypothetical protein